VKPDKMHNIIKEWQRIFPRLRALPCTVDIYCLRSYTRDNVLTEGFDDDITEELNRDMTEDSDKDMTEYSDDDITEVSEDEMTEDSDADMTEVSEDEMSEDWDDDEFACNRLNIRIRLWRALGYGERYLIHEWFEHKWQTSMETEIIGWPVVPISVFHDSGLLCHS
jgi:hypothetical protein